MAAWPCLSHSMSYPSHVFGDTNRCRSLYRTTSFSAPVCYDEKAGSQSKASDGNTVSESLLTYANTVGIIGGVSAGSSLRFLKKLVTWCSSSDGEGSAVPFVLCSDPTLHREIGAHEKSVVPCSFKTERRDRTCVMNNLLQKRTFLEKSGVGCIVMPCHISHLWYDEVSKGCSIPFFHVGECVAKEIKEAKLKPVEPGSPLRIGVLGTSATLSAGIYQEKLQKQGFEVVIPDEATMARTVNPAVQALHRQDIEGAKILLRVALQLLLVRAVSTIILASDDMRDLLPEDDPLLKKCIDPMDVLVRSIIKWAESIGQG